MLLSSIFVSNNHFFSWDLGISQYYSRIHQLLPSEPPGNVLLTPTQFYLVFQGQKTYRFIRTCPWNKFIGIQKKVLFSIFEILRFLGFLGPILAQILTFLILGHFWGQNGLKRPKIFKIEKIEKSTFYCIPMNLFHVNFEEKWTFQ